MNVPFLRPPLGDAEIESVTRVMKTTSLSSGTERTELEHQFAEYIGVSSATAVCNGTIALDLIWQTFLRSKHLKPGDKVLVPSFTFVATANSIVNAGLIPVFCDIDPETWNININKNPYPCKAVCAVHTFGNPVNNLDVLYDNCKTNNILLVEDCAEACGAEYNGKKVGSFGDAAAFSFNTTKNMTTGEGGMVTFKKDNLAYTAKILKEHGLCQPVRDAIIPGYNYRLSNIQAAIGLEQLKTLDARNAKRIANAGYLTNNLTELDLGITVQKETGKNVYQIYGFLVPERIDRNKVLDYLIEQGVEAKNYFDPPIHQQNYYTETYNFSVGLDVTNNIANRVICLPFDDKLSREEMDYMIDRVYEVIG